ncbi:MAG TPA: hypothetical protein VHS53_10080, partial [Mucilaginibacter sp.]|nr:hypothetical protein [Mucilaginibacter sp.]
MKLTICSFLFLVFCNGLFAQDTSIIEKTFLQVAKESFSTAPNFIVITVKNLNTGQSKEICTDMSSLEWSLMQEGTEGFIKDEKNYLPTKYRNRIFDFRNIEALKRLEFDTYTLSSSERIEFLIKKEHLR